MWGQDFILPPAFQPAFFALSCPDRDMVAVATRRAEAGPEGAPAG
jgi:hypothetical protein